MTSRRDQHGRQLYSFTVFAVTLAVALSRSNSAPTAQETTATHLNPVVEKLSQGKTVFGVTTRDFSVENAHALARADLDYVRVEMEHTPLDFGALRDFLLGMLDRSAILKQGSAKQKVAPIVRLPPYGREQAHWVVKQALDQGMMGMIFNGIDDKEQAISAVRSMRYPQRRGSHYMEPAGLRGFSPTNAVWFWGIPTDEYVQHADLWPLNPDGDLLAVMLIESVEGLKNVNEIAATPGVGALYAGTGDLSMSMGVPGNSPEVEEAVQTILRACLSHNVACKINTNARDVQKRLNEGWKILNVGDADGGITAPIDATLRAGRAAVR